MAKITVLENLGKMDKKPIWGDRCHYEIQKVCFEGKEFYRRKKIIDGIVSSQSYALTLDSKRWYSSYKDVIKKQK